MNDMYEVCIFFHCQKWFLPSSYSPCLILTMLVTPLLWLLELLLTATLSLLTDPLASVRLVSGQIFILRLRLLGNIGTALITVTISSALWAKMTNTFMAII